MIPYTTTLNTNSAPEIPQRPEGTDEGIPGSVYLFSTMTTDLDDDGIFYLFSWGDETYSEWIGPYASGEQAGETHSWDEQGVYEVKVKAKDTFGQESDWSEPFAITMPKDKALFFSLLDILEQFFPNIVSFLKGL